MEPKRSLENPVLAAVPLGFTWPTLDPFLFCAHHDDLYPAGNNEAGPAASLEGRNLGQDFEGKDGWRMYHGEKVPGFPQHPHRGFETVTIVRDGLIDHTDSLGATARFGHGDVQWLTAGKGILHSEMFPLLKTDAKNPLELFQIWLNLPRVDKLVDPHFTMFWANEIPKHVHTDANGKKTEVAVIAGTLGDKKALAPPPKSWAAREHAGVSIWNLKLEAGATFTVPAVAADHARVLYFFVGKTLTVRGAETYDVGHALQLQPDADVEVTAGDEAVELLLLGGRPLGEPVVQHGPFVMNSQEEILRTFEEYRRTEFGGWKAESNGPVHALTSGRFARHADGRHETPLPVPDR